MRALLFILVVGNLLLLGLAFTPNPHEQQDIATPPLPPGVKTLQLLSERPGLSKPAGKQESASAKTAQAKAPEPQPAAESPARPASEQQAPPPPSGPVCHTVGPFGERAAADRLARKLDTLGAETAMRESEIQVPAGYWVYLPSMKHDQAQEIIDDLVAHGVEDYFLGKDNYISLGIFSRQDTAQERVEEITGLGYKPRLEQRFKVRKVYWLDAEEPKPLLDEAQWSDLLADFEGVRRQNLACE